MPEKELAQFKPSTTWTHIEIISEPYVVMTSRGYAPVVEVTVGKRPYRQILYISAKSLSDALEEMRQDNSELFSGLRFEISKESEVRTSSYVFR
jgi:hypothetical protein